MKKWCCPQAQTLPTSHGETLVFARLSATYDVHFLVALYVTSHSLTHGEAAQCPGGGGLPPVCTLLWAEMAPQCALRGAS